MRNRNPSHRNATWAVVALVALGCVLPAQSGKGKKNEPKPKPDPYAVVQVDADIRVVKEASIKSLKLEIDQKYKAALADYRAAQKEARKKKEKFDQPKPKKARLKVLKRRCKDQAEADAYVAKVREREAKKRERKSRGKERTKKERTKKERTKKERTKKSERSGKGSGKEPDKE